MSNKSIIILFFLFITGISLANKFADNGPVPGELFIVGPDVSLDSTDLTLLYHTQDTGRTLIIMGTISSLISFAADKNYGTIYKRNPYGVYRSYDLGETWENIYDVGKISSGISEGEICLAYGNWSTNYGDSFSQY